ncbi:MAG TPA: helix-turn-helix transcriptional regulator [Burkholderiales bacterium]|nr:helix-turn-helix transcriptional regulator [Burkholderiales bacterium]
MKQRTTKIRSVYQELGYPDAEAMAVKARLVVEIADLIKRRGLTQTEAAVLLEIPQPKLSGILRGQFRGISERKLMDCLTRLGRDVQIVVKPTPRSRSVGRVSVAVG